MVNKENRPLTERWCVKYGKFKKENLGNWDGIFPLQKAGYLPKRYTYGTQDTDEEFEWMSRKIRS